MTTFIDSNILMYLSNPEAPLHKWATDQLNARKGEGPVCVSDVVYAEFAYAFETQEEVDAVITALALIRVSCSNRELFRASRAFQEYNTRRETSKIWLLPDFFVGAAAEVEGAPLMTNDQNKIPTYFPDVVRIQPP